jgi:hypothetical protein
MFLTVALLSLFNTAVAPDSVAGVWRVKIDVSGTIYNEVCTVTQTASTLGGSCLSDANVKYDLTGEMTDGKLTFQHGGVHDGQNLTIIFTGTLETPRELKGTVFVKPFDVAGTFTAAPVPPGTPTASPAASPAATPAKP